MVRYLILIAALYGGNALAATPIPVPNVTQAGLIIAYQDIQSAARVNFATVAAGLPFDFQVRPRGSRTYTAAIDGKALAETAPGRWRWLPPNDGGHHRITIRGRDPEETSFINVAVTIPAAQQKKGRLNGYHIGDYPLEPMRGLSIYERPQGFVEVHPEHLSLPVSPRFTLGQFLCKQASGYPKYLLLNSRLLQKLEYLLDRLNESGYPVVNFEIMSGYRTPIYNALIGNGRYSRHLWGDAADIFIDQHPRDGVMDDLNKDGVIDKADALWLVNFIESLDEREDYQSFVGGLSPYDSTAAHGPFVHVDVRGWRARW